MIRLQRITTADTDLYSYMEKLMTQSIPSEEYRELEELRKYTDTKTHFYNNIIFHNNTPVGLITYWDFGHFYYIEHFAIDPAQRNGGYGKSVLNHLCQLLKHPIVLVFLHSRYIGKILLSAESEPSAPPFSSGKAGRRRQKAAGRARLQLQRPARRGRKQR